VRGASATSRSRSSSPRPRPCAPAAERARIDELLDAVGATAYADAPVATLSGGEQQRLRVAQALASDPRLLLCDEPLLSLDLGHQRVVSELIDRHRRETDAAVVFVTHDINPVLDMVDRVLYLVGGRFRIGTPDEVLDSEVLSSLYGTPVDVVRVRGRVVVVGATDDPQGHHSHDDEEHDEHGDHGPHGLHGADAGTATRADSSDGRAA
jgi:zinc/manganese transport system ATP-binding protein